MNKIFSIYKKSSFFMIFASMIMRASTASYNMIAHNLLTEVCDSDAKLYDTKEKLKVLLEKLQNETSKAKRDSLTKQIEALNKEIEEMTEVIKKNQAKLTRTGFGTDDEDSAKYYDLCFD